MNTEYLKEYTRNKDTLKDICTSRINVPKDIVKRASTLLMLLRIFRIKQPEFITPHADGGAIQMEYENKKWYLEINILEYNYEILLLSNDDHDDIPIVDLELETKHISEVLSLLRKYTSLYTL